MSECVEIHDSAIGDLSRDLATIHQICASHLNDLRKLSDSDTQVTTPLQGCHGHGKSSGKCKKFPGQGKVRELHFQSGKFKKK